MNGKKKIIIAVTGASGSVYAHQLFLKLNTLKDQIEEVAVIFSETACKVWQYELENTEYNKLEYPIYSNNDFFSPTASGSSGFDCMIIIPCSMGTLGRIANGTSNDLISRSADVMLKEKRKLIMVLREMPFNLIHIENMKSVTLAGAIICPASPSFYSKPDSIDKLVATVTDKVLSLAGFKFEFYKWGEKNS